MSTRAMCMSDKGEVKKMSHVVNDRGEKAVHGVISFCVLLKQVGRGIDQSRGSISLCEEGNDINNLLSHVNKGLVLIIASKIYFVMNLL